jgi:hypothetical protein
LNSLPEILYPSLFLKIKDVLLAIKKANTNYLTLDGRNSKVTHVGETVPHRKIIIERDLGEEVGEVIQ